MSLCACTRNARWGIDLRPYFHAHTVDGSRERPSRERRSQVLIKGQAGVSVLYSVPLHSQQWPMQVLVQMPILYLLLVLA